MKIKINLSGCTRIVFISNQFVFKFPNFLYEHSHFLKGCIANWNERKYSKWKVFDGKIARTYFCSWFGLMSIQERCHPISEQLSKEQTDFFKEITGDIKKENFGINKSGNLVCLDYGE